MNDAAKSVLSIILIIFAVTACDRFKSARDLNKEKKQTSGENEQYRMVERFRDNKTQIIDLIEGTATFEIKYEGDSAFTARLLNNEGDLIAILADVRGPYKETKTFNVPKTSSYILDVKTTGWWSVYRR